MNITKSLLNVGALLSLAVVGVATSASAGQRNNEPVYVASTYAYGSMGSARTSGDNTQYIGCYAFSYHDGDVNVGCQARDANGNSVYCYSTDPQFVQAVSAVNDESHIYFVRNSSSSQCTNITVGNHSYNQVKN